MLIDIDQQDVIIIEEVADFPIIDAARAVRRENLDQHEG
jgi:hypothetical protein